jgi:hypothetical protein
MIRERVDNFGPIDTPATFPIQRCENAFIPLDAKLFIFEQMNKY